MLLRLIWDRPFMSFACCLGPHPWIQVAGKTEKARVWWRRSGRAEGLSANQVPLIILPTLSAGMQVP